MRQATKDEWLALVEEFKLDDRSNPAWAGVIDDYISTPPGYAGKVIVVVRDQPESVHVYGVDGAGRLYKMISTFD